ncbi:meiosis protein SPO22/ZIP4 like-domain-containing protein [Lipomyces arxii]|uniref:meiosis protein SPO22/ZIP4 like-domain-containing protein n=1 Tax=Lipomyces arxii TaxID=56418 RepID=UPI0034CF641E
MWNEANAMNTPTSSAKTQSTGSSLEKRIRNVQEQASTLLEKLRANPNDISIANTTEAVMLTLEQLLFTLTKGKHTSTSDSLLDDIGTQTWNIATILIRERDGINKSVACAVRSVSCLMIDCAQRLSKSSITPTAFLWTTLIYIDGFRVLKCYLKAVKMCLDNDEMVYATKLVDKLSKLHESLSNPETPMSKTDAQLFYAMTIEYHVLRIYLAKKQQNTSLMELMFAKIPEDKTPSLPMKKLEYLADILSDIGADMLRKRQFEDAKLWLSRAADMFLRIDAAEDMLETTIELKFNVMRNYVRALVGTNDTEDATKAKDVLRTMEDEFPSTIWLLDLKFDVARREDSTQEMHDAVIMQMIFLGTLTNSSFNIIMKEIQVLGAASPAMACRALDYLLTKKLALCNEQEWLETAFVTRIYLISKDASMQREESESALDRLFSELAKMISKPISAKAVYSSQILLWKVGESFYTLERYKDAMAWFKLAVHLLFYNSGEANNAKILRKIMLCDYSLQEYSSIQDVFEVMPASSREAPQTQYIMYKTALALLDDTSGEGNKSQQCLQTIASSPTFNIKILSACAMEAQERDNKPLTLAAMQLIIQKLPDTNEQEDVNEYINLPALIRCVIRLVSLEIDKVGSANALKDINSLCQYYENAYVFAKRPRLKGDNVFNANECEWFARNAYNTALKGCRNWPPESTVRLADCSLKFMGLYIEMVDKNDKSIMINISWQRILAMFLSASAAIYMARSKDLISEQKELYQLARRHIRVFKLWNTEYLQLLNRTKDLQSELETKTADLKDKCAAMMAFDFEAVANLESWAELVDVTEEVTKLRPDTRIYEGLVDILLSASSPPDETLVILQIILGATMTSQDETNLDKLSRWIRCLISTALPRRPEVAQQILAQVLAKLTDYRERYPVEETHWLATTCWNYGVDLYCVGDVQGCKRWCEVAISLAGFVNDIIERQMQQNYLRICGFTDSES